MHFPQLSGVILAAIAVGRGCCQDEDKFRLASYFSDHMVLQRSGDDTDAPPTVWGYAPPLSTVEIRVTAPGGGVYGSEPVTSGDNSYWLVKLEDDEHLESQLVGPGYTVDVINTDVSGEAHTIRLVDVAFGDVWFCSGQSNMEWRVKSVRSAAAEITTATDYEDIRLLKVVREVAKEPVSEPLGYLTQWTAPTEEFLWADSFSAICLMFGEQIYDEIGVPIGLIDSSWGRTNIEAWMPPETLEECGVTDNGGLSKNHNSYLWNAMVHPFTRMAIKGALWYQGENNAGYEDSDYRGHNRELYECNFAGLIRSWRRYWDRNLLYDTSFIFPFGLVQLAPYTNQTTHLAWPELRWMQTRVSQEVSNVFMAVTVDDDFDLHPKNKRLPATRLGWAAANRVYSLERPGAGPEVVSVVWSNDTVREAGGMMSSVMVKFSEYLTWSWQQGDTPFTPFHLCCLETMEDCDKVPFGAGWVSVDSVDLLQMYPEDVVIHYDAEAVCQGLGTRVSGLGTRVSGLAYLWLETPCAAEESCPLYSDSEHRLPVAPFKTPSPQYYH